MNGAYGVMLHLEEGNNVLPIAGNDTGISGIPAFAAEAISRGEECFLEGIFVTTLSTYHSWHVYQGCSRQM